VRATNRPLSALWLDISTRETAAKKGSDRHRLDASTVGVVVRREWNVHGHPSAVERGRSLVGDPLPRWRFAANLKNQNDFNGRSGFVGILILALAVEADRHAAL